MPTGHCKWKCLVTEIRPAEEVALTALSGHSDAKRYYKIQEDDIRHPKLYMQTLNVRSLKTFMKLFWISTNIFLVFFFNLDFFAIE